VVIYLLRSETYLSVPEIARELGRSQGTVSQTLRDLTARLRTSEALQVAVHRIRQVLADDAAMDPVVPPLRPPAAHVLSRLRDMRVAAGLTQQELAERAGVARETLARLECGARAARRQTAVSLARALGLALVELTEPAQAHSPRADGPLDTDGSIGVAAHQRSLGARLAPGPDRA